MVRKFNFCLILKVDCFKQKSTTFTPASIINLFIVYILDASEQDLNSDLTLRVAYLRC